MGIHVAHFEQEGQARWGVVHDGTISPLAGNYLSLREFLESGRGEAVQVRESGTGSSIRMDSVRLLSPVTAPCSIVCQGLNYGSHRAEAGAQTEKPPFNLLFMKAASSLSGPNDDVVRPRGIRLLDYEIELGLVIGAPIRKRTTITEDNLFDYAAGIVISNDVSARDVQIPQQQWFKGKSYRTFCPTGPFLYLMDADDRERLRDIEIRLEVNGEVRQQANTGQMLYGPAETLTELSGLMDLYPGDLIQTGTPGGVAIKAPPAHIQRIARILLDEKKMMQTFLKRQAKNPNYLKNGDTLRLTMRSRDGVIDLGVMETTIVPED